MLCFAHGMMGYLSRAGVLLKDFGDHAQAMTKRLIEASTAAAEQADRPIEYLPSPKIRKDQYARNIALRHHIQDGLICVLTAVEPCKTYEIYRNRAKKILQMKARMRTCKFVYHYCIDPRFGFISARIQTCFPFSIPVCVNGREWLSRRMDEVGLPYQRYENGFPWIDDFTKAQTIMERMHKINRPRALDATFGSRDVPRFLGKRPDRRYQGEAPRDSKDRPEGVRIKHQAYRNSVKAYDKGGFVLRVETTITNPAAFQPYRSREGDPDGPKSWRQMRKGVADMHRRASGLAAVQPALCRGVGVVGHIGPIIQLAAKVCRPVRNNGRR